MGRTSQQRAIDLYRARLTKRGLARFEVVGRSSDRDLIRSVAKALSEGGPDADRIRETVTQAISGSPPPKGGIVRALLASPLVGSEIEVTRVREGGRKIDI